MENRSEAMDTLRSKVNELIKRLETQSIQIKELASEISSLKAQNESKSAEISKLYEELNNAGVGFEDIIENIDRVLDK